MRNVMDLVVRLFLSIVFVGIPLCSDLLLRRYLGVSTLGAIPTIALYAPFFYLIKKTWKHPTPPKQDQSFNDTVFADAKPTACKPRRVLVLICAVVISLSFGSYLGFYFGQQSMEPALEEQYQIGYDKGYKKGDSDGYERGLDIGHKYGYDKACKEFNLNPNKNPVTKSFSTSSWEEMKERNLNSPPNLFD